LGLQFDVLINPEFREDCRDLETTKLQEVDLLIYRLRAGEITGIPNGKCFEITTPSSMAIYYDLEKLGGKMTLILRMVRCSNP